MFINNPKGGGKRIAVDRQKVKTSSEFQRYRMAGRLEEPCRQNGQAGRYGV